MTADYILQQWKAVQGNLFLIVIAILAAPSSLNGVGSQWMTGIADAPGEFAELSNGITHYQFHGSVDGPLLVCVHGLTTPSFVYEGLAKRLVERGHRVLVKDHYGRISTAQGRSRSALCPLRRVVGTSKHRHHFGSSGYSMGMLSPYAAMHPKMIKRLFLLVPAGMGHDWGGPPNWCAMCPSSGIGCLWPHMLPSIVAVARLNAPGHYGPLVVDRQQKELQYRGFIPSVLASLRGALANDTKEDHQRIAYHELDVRAIWGADDVVMPPLPKIS